MSGSIVERLLYGMVKGRVAGTTMSAAITKVKALNDKKLPVSVAFLTAKAVDRPKARYATTTYIELVRRISRLGLKASVQVPLDQIGGAFSKEAAAENLRSILDASNRYGVFVWAELSDVKKELGIVPDAKGLGYVVGIKDVDLLAGMAKKQSFKIVCGRWDGHGGENGKEDKKQKKGKDHYRDELKRIESVMDASTSVVLQSAPDELVKLLLDVNRYKKALIFEFQLGFSKGLLKSVLKKGWRTSVYVPFGKDWTGYVMTRMQGHYTRMIANRLLKEKK